MSHLPDGYDASDDDDDRIHSPVVQRRHAANGALICYVCRTNDQGEADVGTLTRLSSLDRDRVTVQHVMDLSLIHI